jgi:hypothetical protein
MKVFTYAFYFLALLYCGCTDANPKEEQQTLACPYIFPAEKDLPSNWVTIGKIPTARLQLRETAINNGDASEEKKRVESAQEPVFSRDIIDEWEERKDRFEATAEYPQDHGNIAIMCTYAQTQKETFDPNKNLVLLIPLPAKKHISCLFTRRDIDPTHEISCTVK